LSPDPSDFKSSALNHSVTSFLRITDSDFSNSGSDSRLRSMNFEVFMVNSLEIKKFHKFVLEIKLNGKELDIS